MSAQVISRLFIDPPLRGATHFGFDRKEILGLAGLSTDALDNCKAGLDAQSYSQLMIAIWKHCNDECMGFEEATVGHHSGLWDELELCEDCFEEGGGGDPWDPE